jgi:hypothetical protein
MVINSNTTTIKRQRQHIASTTNGVTEDRTMNSEQVQKTVTVKAINYNGEHGD